MTSFNAWKLTFLRRIFYVIPKEILLFVYFKVLKKHKHSRYLLFHKLIADVAYVTKYHDKDRAPMEWIAKVQEFASDSTWWERNSYIGREFQWKIISGYLERLKDYIGEKTRAPF